MWTIGYMAWRIGEIVRLEEQIAWIARAGFRGVGFHAAAGSPGSWEGVDPATSGPDRRTRLREMLDKFETVEVHAPFATALGDDTLATVLSDLNPILELARDLGAAIVTVHGELPETAADASGAWLDAMKILDAKAAECGARIGLEVVRGFDFVKGLRLANVGITLDVGHMYALDGGRGLRAFGTISDAVRHIGEKLFHLHVHDYDGRADHIEIGTGIVDFDGLLKALAEIGYRGAMTVEMHPGRVSPEGMIRSRVWIERRTRELGLA